MRKYLIFLKWTSENIDKRWALSQKAESCTDNAWKKEQKIWKAILSTAEIKVSDKYFDSVFLHLQRNKKQEDTYLTKNQNN